jgi:hypothetical protein
MAGLGPPTYHNHVIEGRMVRHSFATMIADHPLVGQRKPDAQKMASRACPIH